MAKTKTKKTVKKSPRVMHLQSLKEEKMQYLKREKQQLKMMEALTKLAVNYSEFVGKMNTILDQCQPLIEKSLSRLNEG